MCNIYIKWNAWKIILEKQMDGHLYGTHHEIEQIFVRED